MSFLKNIFDPLGMKDTYFNVPTAKANHMAAVYTEDEKHSIIPWSPAFRNINPDYQLKKTAYFSDRAGLSSTALITLFFYRCCLAVVNITGINYYRPVLCK